MEWNQLLSLETQIDRPEEPEKFNKYPISDLEKDYQSIISSSAFRRLQDKTQVFPLDKSDFVRTRLTHSIEVSTIARQLGIMVTQNTTNFLQPDFKEPEIREKIPVVLSCAGLLHDIGNPPFGHFGEVVIGEWFQKELSKEDFSYKGKPISTVLTPQMKKDLEHFEGNAQALRILSKAKNHEEGYDINLSYCILSTLVKYPTNSLVFDKNDEDVKKHKPGYYFAEKDMMSKISSMTGTENGDSYVRHPLVYLMEAADDIAYATADLEDALKKDMFTVRQFIDFFDESVQKLPNDRQGYPLKLKKELSDIIGQEQIGKEKELIAFQKWMVNVRKWLMFVAAYRFSKSYKDIMNGTYRYDLFYDTNHQDSIDILKKAMGKFVYNNREIVKLELSAKKIISSLLNDFIYAVIYWDAEDEKYKLSKTDEKYIHLISENYKIDYGNSKTGDDAEDLYRRFLMITDFISGMTDSYARNLYQEINGIEC